MAIFMQLKGIDGSATETAHSKWIECASFNFGIGRSINSMSANRETSKAQVSEISITKQQDLSSTELFKSSLTGRDGIDCQIDFTRTGSGSNDDIYFTLKLTNTLISSFSVGSGGDEVTESVSLSFTKIEYTFFGYDATNKTGNPKKPTFDLTTSVLS